MSDVTLSRAIRSNLLHLQSTAALMDKTQERLATGKKVNSALDNPTNFFTSSALNARAADISSLLDAMSNGIRTIEAADNGLTAITKEIESMQASLRQARQDRSFDIRSLALDPTAIGAAPPKSLTLGGGSLGTTPVDVPLQTQGTTPPTPASVTGETGGFSAPTAAGDAVTAIPFTAVTLDNAGDEIGFTLALNGGATVDITIDKAIADAASGDNSGVLDTAAKYAAAIQAGLDAQGVTGLAVGVSGTDVTLTAVAPDPATPASIAITGAGFTDGGGAALTSTGGIADGTTTGAAAQTRAITINGVPITLTAPDHATPEAAADHINAVLAAETPPIAITATGDDGTGTLSLAAAADGTTAITLGGDADDVFGAAPTETPLTPGSGDTRPKTVDELVNWINADAATRGKVRASNDNGKLRIENLSTLDLTVTGFNAATGRVDGGTGTAEPLEGNKIRANLAEQYNLLKTQLDRLSEDSSYNGVNLLRGDELKIVFNETGTSEIRIQVKDRDGVVRPVSADQLGLPQIGAENLNTDEQIDALLANLTAALSEVRTQSSSLGANLSSVQNREDFTKKMMNTLETGAANLTLADTNEEAANLLALQTRQQLSQTALSLASQADQAVLRLFG